MCKLKINECDDDDDDRGICYVTSRMRNDDSACVSGLVRFVWGVREADLDPMDVSE